MFEKSGKGKISVRDLGALLRCLGWNPSEHDLEVARHEFDVSTRGNVTFAEVERYVARRGGIYLGTGEEEDILAAFKVLDIDGKGKISINDFRRFMTTMGDKMSPDEVEELIKIAKKDGVGFIEYKGEYA
ncbi:hypothetical protein ScPMuIL_009511 [Solemya velum]